MISSSNIGGMIVDEFLIQINVINFWRITHHTDSQTEKRKQPFLFIYNL